MDIATNAFGASMAAKSSPRRASTAAVSPARSAASPGGAEPAWKRQSAMTDAQRREKFFAERKGSMGWIDRPDGMEQRQINGVKQHRFSEEDDAAGDVDDWEGAVNPQGRAFFRHPGTTATRWDPPPGWMPPGARAARAEKAIEEEVARLRAAPWAPPPPVKGPKEYSDACCVLS